MLLSHPCHGPRYCRWPGAASLIMIGTVAIIVTTVIIELASCSL